jgi:two-component system, sensor histidine kinase YesM
LFKICIKRATCFFNGMSLAKKFIFSYLFIIAIPSAVLGVYAFRNIKAGTIKEAVKNDMYSIQQLKSYISRNIEVCNRAAQQAISNTDLIEFLDIKRDYTSEDVLELKDSALARFESIHNINPDIHKIRFFADNPRLEEIWPSIYSGDWLKKKPWREKVIDLKGNNFWLLNHIEESLHSVKTEKVEEVVSLYRNVSYIDNFHVATLEVSMVSKFFWGDIYNSGLDESTFLCVVNKNNDIIYNDKSSFLKKWIGEINAIQLELSKNYETREGSFEFALPKGKFLSSCAYIKDLDSIIYKVTSVEDLTGKLDSTRNTILIGIIIGIIVLAAVTYFITSVLLKKMKTIIMSMRKVQAGNLSVEIPLGGNDEIGELAHHFRKMMDNINELINVVVRKQATAKDAELRALQTQINAHFIYNVLEAIKTEAEIENKYQISDYLTALGRLMRYSMHWSNIYVTLKQEIDYIRNYLALMNLRCENKIEVDISLRDDMQNLEILKMTIQPIVENAINHGLAPKNWQGKLEVRAYEATRKLYVEVMDNGVGMSPEQLAQLHEKLMLNVDTESTGDSGIGIKNVNERIKLFYGEEYGLKIESKEYEYTKVWIILPYRKGLWG